MCRDRSSLADADRKNGLQDDFDGEFEGDDELDGDRYNPDEDERRMRVSVAKNRKYRVDEASNLLRGGMGVMPRQERRVKLCAILQNLGEVTKMLPKNNAFVDNGDGAFKENERGRFTKHYLQLDARREMCLKGIDDFHRKIGSR